MTVKELIETLQVLEQDKEILIEGCNEINIEDEIDFYQIEFWYSKTTK